MARAHVVVIRHRVDWIQRKPEVIAWIRSQYREDCLPDWVGRLQEGTDYEELLRSKGVELPVAEAPMEEGAEGEGRYVEQSNEELDPKDVEVGIPVQASTIGDVDPEQPAPTDTYLHQQAPTYSNQQAAPSAELPATNKQHLLQSYQQQATYTN